MKTSEVALVAVALLVIGAACKGSGLAASPTTPPSNPTPTAEAPTPTPVPTADPMHFDIEVTASSNEVATGETFVVQTTAGRAGLAYYHLFVDGALASTATYNGEARPGVPGIEGLEVTQAEGRPDGGAFTLRATSAGEYTLKVTVAGEVSAGPGGPWMWSSAERELTVTVRS